MKPTLAIATFIAVGLATTGCEKREAGNACKRSSQCVERHHCVAEKCAEEGSKHIVDITLVGNDHDNLACSIDGDVAGLTCSHGPDQKQVRAEPARETDTRLQPMTTKDHLTILVAGVWSQPEVQKKVKKAKPTTRFTASCQVVLRGSVEKARVRWKRGEAWMPATHVPVMAAESCTVGRK